VWSEDNLGMMKVHPKPENKTKIQKVLNLSALQKLITLVKVSKTRDAKLLKKQADLVCTGTVCCITVWTNAPTSGFTKAPCNNSPLYNSSDVIVGICGTIAQTSDTPLYASDNCDLTPLNFLAITQEKLCNGDPVCAQGGSTPPSALNIGPKGCTTTISDCDCSNPDCTYPYQVWGLFISEIIFPGVFETTVTVQDCGGGVYAVISATPITITDTTVFPFYNGVVFNLLTTGTGCATGAVATYSPLGAFIIDNLLYKTSTSSVPYIDYLGLLYTSAQGYELNFWGCAVGWQVYFYSQAVGTYSAYPTPTLLFE